MSVNYNPSVVTSRLLLNLDAGNLKSYPTSGTAWTDLSGNANNGTLVNGPTFNSANGGSLVFDGVDDYTQLGSISAFQFANNQPYTLATWIYWSPVSASISTIISYGRVVGLLPTTGDQGYYISLDNGVLRNASFFFDYYDGSNSISIQGNANSIPINSWTYLVGTNNGSNTASGLSFYVNGTLSSYTTRINTNPSTINYTNANFNVGARDGKSNFIGKISTGNVYNRALSADEVLQNYNALRGRYGL
jgi:hypothetical protein